MFGAEDEYRDAVRNMLRRVALSQNARVGKDHVLGSIDGRIGEQYTDVPISHSYGFHAEPLKGASALLLSLGGRSDAPHIIGVDDPRGRPKLGPGGVAIWDASGNVASFVQRKIRFVSPDHIHLSAPSITSSVEIQVTG